MSISRITTTIIITPYTRRAVQMQSMYSAYMYCNGVPLSAVQMHTFRCVSSFIMYTTHKSNKNVQLFNVFLPLWVSVCAYLECVRNKGQVSRFPFFRSPQSCNPNGWMDEVIHKRVMCVHFAHTHTSLTTLFPAFALLLLLCSSVFWTFTTWHATFCSAIKT